MRPTPTMRTAANSKKSADCLNHAIAGTESAKARPRKLISKERRLIPARKVPSARNIKITRLLAGGGNMLCIPGRSMMFITTKMVAQ